MATTTAKQQRLAAVPMFSACGRAELKRIEQVADELSLPAGRRIVGKGEFGQEFFIVESGTVEVRRDGQVVATLGPGSYFGELALLGAPRRTADVVAATDVELVVLTVRDFNALLMELPQMACTLLRTLATRLAALESAEKAAATS